MKKMITIGAALLATVSLSACGTSTSSTNSSSTSTAKKAHSKYYFDGKTANLRDVKIHIDRVRFYQASEETDNKNLICFDYTITNKTDKDINALSGWQAVFNAYQDNKNTEGKLEVGALPSDTSDQVLHDQDQTIKKNGTVKCRTAYELSSASKPVVLKAAQGVDGKFLGKKTYKISKLVKSSQSVSSSEHDQAAAKNSSTAATSTTKNTSSASNTTSGSNGNTSKLRDVDPEYWDALSPQEKKMWASDPDPEDYINSPGLVSHQFNQQGIPLPQQAPAQASSTPAGQ